MRALAVIASILITATITAADPRLVVTHEPSPRHLKMRARTVAAAPPTVTTSPIPAPPPPIARAAEPLEQIAALRDVRQRVSFSIDVGYQLDGARLRNLPTLDGRTPVSGQDFATMRSYGFGEGFLSTRGVGLRSLESYFAVRFQAARALTTIHPDTGERVDVAPPMATWFERSGGEARTGWAELRDFLPSSWKLSKVRMRAGTQHVYGPWIVHFDGILISYDGPLLTASLYSGARHADYARDLSAQRPGIAGASARIDLRGLSTSVPIAIQGEYLFHGPTDITGLVGDQPASNNTLLQADWRPARDTAVIVQLRQRNSRNASQRVEARTRLRQVTNVVLELIRRTTFDWAWDPSLTNHDADTWEAKRYLDLGPVAPQLLGSLRAGTLIAENVDIYLRGALSSDLRGAPEDRTTFSAPYAELGGGLEVQLRRTVALGTSILSRTINREPQAMPTQDIPGAQPLPPSGAQGEDGFTEVGTTLKISLGARRFSAQVEGYGRRTRFDKIYQEPDLTAPEVPISDVRLGGRFSVDAWVGDRVRLFGAYDVSGLLDTAPEISGYKSLRLMMSGVY